MVISVSSSIQKQAVSCLFSRLKFLFNTSSKERINHDILLLHHKGSLQVINLKVKRDLPKIIQFFKTSVLFKNC